MENGGVFVCTYLTAMADRNDLCFLGGAPAGSLKEVFGIWHEETDALPEDWPGRADFLGKTYPVEHICDIIHARGAKVLGEYRSDFYSGMPAVTENACGRGTAYTVAFRSDASLAEDVCAYLTGKFGIGGPLPRQAENVSVQRRGDLVFVMNFGDEPKTLTLPDGCSDALTGAAVPDGTTLAPCEYLVLTQTDAPA